MADCQFIQIAGFNDKKMGDINHGDPAFIPPREQLGLLLRPNQMWAVTKKGLMVPISPEYYSWERAFNQQSLEPRAEVLSQNGSLGRNFQEMRKHKLNIWFLIHVYVYVFM